MMTPLQHDKWTPLTADELKAYMGFCMLMGIVRLPHPLRKKTSTFYYAPIASKIARDRFRDIRRHLHFRDNTTRGTDRLAKVRPLIDKINERCSAASA